MIHLQYGHTCHKSLSTSDQCILMLSKSISCQTDQPLSIGKKPTSTCSAVSCMKKDGGTWNFSEAGHGKGAADGVGGVLKRTADTLLANGLDLPNAEAVYDALLGTGTSVKLFYVPESAIQEMDKVVPKHLVPIPGTMTIHQVISSKPFHIMYRDLGCTCSESMCCACFDVKHFRFPLHLECSESDNAQSSGSIEISDKRDVFLRPITAAMQGGTGQWCAVKYDEVIYPGLILKAGDESVEVRSMARVDSNRFKWPAKDDILEYDYDDVISLIPEPKQVTARHVQVDPLLWSLISDHDN